MALKKSALYSSLWKSCDELRGGMDASQFKDYVLTLLFVKHVSDKYRGDPNALIEISAGGSFDDMVRLKGNKEIGDKINKIIRALAYANDLKTVIDVADFADEDKLGKGKEMVDRLTNLIAIFEGLDLRANRAEGDDLLGDAYIRAEESETLAKFDDVGLVKLILDEELALQVDEAVREIKKADWRGAMFKEREVRRAIRERLAAYGKDEMADAIFELVKNQREY
jgi:hypothetical protein